MFSYMFSNTNINGYFSCVFVVFVVLLGMKAIKKACFVTNLDKLYTTKPNHIEERTVHEQKMAVCLTCLFLCESVAILQ